MAIDPIITESYFKPITNAATGRVAFEVKGVDGTTKTVENGDTGVRDLSGLFNAGKVTSGRVLVRRIGNVVTWTLVSLNLAGPVASVHDLIGNTGLAGFMPDYLAAASLMQSEAEHARLITGTNSLSIHYGMAGVNYVGVLTYVTGKAWPTALPGVADGQPVSV